MGKSLVIVESPAKAKTINKYLGRKYTVKASMGHVRDLPKSKLGIDIENNFTPKYLTIRGQKKIISDLEKRAKEADKVFLAPDPDREGEAIAWHLVEALKIKEDKVFRITFNQITKRAVKEAIENPGKISMDRVNAQQARRILDRIVGYNLSPLLWKKIAKGLSAGRVQSVAVRLIVERERDISAFKSEEYWKLFAMLHSEKASSPFRADILKVDGKRVKIENKETADALLKRLEGQPFVVGDVEKSKKTDRPRPPFSTSTLQQQASIRLRFSAKKTMRIAQQLYEGISIGDDEQTGLITYMRTDSFHVAVEALDECREYIAGNFDKEYLPKKANAFASRKGAQAAHEAVRPTGAMRTPQLLESHLTKDQMKLYKLIWERFVASQMTPARYDLTQVTINAEKMIFTAKGKVQVFAGHTILLKPVRDKEGDELLPSLKVNETLVKDSVEATQHFTQPPPRYTEATLVKALEKKGIGRPSTYAAIISTIQDRGYVTLGERKFRATELGDVVITQLVNSFPTLINTEFTSGMEEKLDSIETGNLDWLDVLRDFYKLFSSDLDAADEKMENLKKNPQPAGMDCSKCGKPMVYLYTKTGRFIGCSGYPDCKNSLSADGEEPKPKEEPIPTDEICSKCNSPMVIRSGKRGKFIACSAYPKCKNTLNIDEEGKPVKPKSTGIMCDKCGTEMVIKFSRRGPFLACPAFPKCRNAKPVPEELKEKPEEIDRLCPECNKKLMIRSGRKGKFIACSGYPECKYTDQVEPEVK